MARPSIRYYVHWNDGTAELVRAETVAEAKRRAIHGKVTPGGVTPDGRKLEIVSVTWQEPR